MLTMVFVLLVHDEIKIEAKNRITGVVALMVIGFVVTLGYLTASFKCFCLS